MIVEASGNRYEWLDNWAKLPVSESSVADGRTHGIQVASNGEVIVFAQCNPAVNFYGSEGQFLRAWGDRFEGSHGMTLVEEDGVEYLWLTDVNRSEVVKVTLDGKTLLNIEKPETTKSEEGKYAPTWVAVNEERFGGNGDVWVADGYGSSLVHRFDKAGNYLTSLDGTEGAGRFACPHGILFDSRSSEPQLLVADRGNHRIQVYDGDGKYVRCFGEEYLTTPDCFSIVGDTLLVPELLGRITLIDGNDQLIGYLGRYDEAKNIPGWPNLAPDQLHPGLFSSPHGGTFDASGNIYIAEWIIGGRITKLAKIS